MSGFLRAAGVAALAAPILAVGVVAAPPAYAVEDECPGLTATSNPGDLSPATSQSQPIAEMEVDQAQKRLAKRGTRAGAGVVVAVLDSGVPEGARPAVNVVEHVDAGNKKPPEEYHGTAVAGLIAGQPTEPGHPIGVAPGAQIFDVQVYDNQDAAADSADESPPTIPNIIQGLDAVIAALPRLNIKVVNISLALPDDAQIEQRIEQLWELGVVTVAPTGNRPSAEQPTGPLAAYAAGHLPGEDAAADVHPADYAHVVAVNSSMTGMPEGTDPTKYVLENSMTKVSAATANGVSYSVFGTPCLLVDPATSWAAAEVSGVIALLQSARDESIQASVMPSIAFALGSWHSQSCRWGSIAPVAHPACSFRGAAQPYRSKDGGSTANDQ